MVYVLFYIIHESNIYYDDFSIDLNEATDGATVQNNATIQIQKPPDISSFQEMIIEYCTKDVNFQACDWSVFEMLSSDWLKMSLLYRRCVQSRHRPPKYLYCITLL